MKIKIPKKLGKTVLKIAGSSLLPALPLTKGVIKLAAPLLSKLTSSFGKEIKSIANTLSPVFQNFTKELQSGFNGKFDTLKDNVQGLQTLLDARLNPGLVSNPNQSLGFISPIGGASQVEEKLLGVVGSLDGQMKSLTDQLNKPNLTEGEMLKLSTQLQRVTRMFELVGQMFKQMHDVQTSFIRNIAR